MKFEGHINEIDLVSKLVELGDQQFTGAIRFESDGIIKILYLKEGDILSASTNDRTDSIDEILLKSGKVTRDHVRQALTRRKENETLGDALLGLGFITKKELVWARRVQVVVIVRSIMKWTDGTFTIVSDYLPKREEGTIFYLRQIVLEIIVTDEDREKFDTILRSGDSIFRRNAHFDEAYKALALNEEADQVVRLVDGRRSASDIAASSAVEPFSVFKLLHALHVLGLLTEANPIHEILPATPRVSRGFELDEIEPEQESAVLLPGVLPEFPATRAEPIETEEALTFDEPSFSEPTFDEDPVSESSVKTTWSESSEHESPSTSRFDASENLPELESDREASMPQIEPVPVERGKRPMVAALIILLLAAGGFGGYTYWERTQRVETTNAPPAKVTRAAVMTETVFEETATAPAVISTTETIAPIAAPLTAAPAKKAEPQPKAPKIAAGTGFKVERTESGYSVSNMDEKRPRTPTAPAQSTPNDPLRKRYDAMAREFAQSSDNAAYTIQFEIVCQTDSVTKALSAGDSSVWFVPINYQGRSCYRVFWGRYDSSTSAERGIAEIPSELRSGKPVVIRPAEVIQP